MSKYVKLGQSIEAINAIIDALFRAKTHGDARRIWHAAVSVTNAKYDNELPARAPTHLQTNDASRK
jgi:hypothetical protein